MDYRRLKIGGGVYFFTIVTQNRKPLLSSPHSVQLLRRAFRHVMKKRPFAIDGIVILPDHIHCIWTLPKNDCDYSTRWRLIKTLFSKHQSITQGGCWQNRFWEHLIRDEEDWRNHMDYIHFNPVKHGLVERVREWPFSSFSQCVEKGWYEPGWGEDVTQEVLNMELE